MEVKNVLTVVALAAVSVAGAETIRIDETPFGAFEVTVPEFASRDFPITDFGAKPGVKCTDAFIAAMEACGKAGGGRVVVPKGTWLTGAVRFRSNCNLHLDDGAVLEFTDDPADYPKVHTTWEGVECLNHSPLLFAYEVENVAITGEGTIDGSGPDFFGAYACSDRSPFDYFRLAGGQKHSGRCDYC